MWTILLPLIGTLVGAAAKHWLGERGWQAVRETAKPIARQILDDPTRTDDPRQAITEAMQQALIQQNLDRLYREARKVEQAFHVNGTNPYPKAK